MLALVCGVAASIVAHQPQPHSAAILLRPQRSLHLSSLFNQHLRPANPAHGVNASAAPQPHTISINHPQLHDHGTEGCRRRYRSLRERESEPLRNFFRCLKSKPEVDYEKFSSICGFGNVPSARSNLSRLMAKLTAEGDTASNASPIKAAYGDDAPQDTPAGKKKGAGRKRKTDNADGDDTEVSPMKKRASPTKGKGKKESAVKKEVDESGDEGADEEV